jgi:hypothetical protein
MKSLTAIALAAAVLAFEAAFLASIATTPVDMVGEAMAREPAAATNTVAHAEGGARHRG